MMARIDPASYTPLPWMKGTARFASDLYVDDKPHPYCPRVNLKRVLNDARRKGYVFNVGMEPEHFLVVRKPDGSIAPWDPDAVDGLAKPCYDYRSMAPAMAYLQEVTTTLNRLGWGVYQTDHEDANSQYEVNFQYTDALTTADRVTFFRMAVSQIAKKHGAIATHMAKPFTDRTGSGLHAHYHLASAETGKSLFEDPSDRRGLGCSETAYLFLGGIFRHARALCAVSSPTRQRGFVVSLACASGWFLTPRDRVSSWCLPAAPWPSPPPRPSRRPDLRAPNCGHSTCRTPGPTSSAPASAPSDN